MQHSIYETTE